jgi:hypothetical protein
MCFVSIKFAGTGFAAMPHLRIVCGNNPVFGYSLLNFNCSVFLSLYILDGVAASNK